MIYQVRDSSVFIIGTIHLVPRGSSLSWTRERSIVDRAETIVFESDFGNPPAPDCHLLGSHGLPDILGRELYDKVCHLARQAQYSEPLDQLKPWFLVIVLTLCLQLRSGASFGGLDKELWEYAKQQGKSVQVLEGGEVFREIDAAPVAESVAALAFLAAHPDEPVSQLGEIYQAWSVSDHASLDVAIARLAQLMPTVHRYLFQERNRLWMQTVSAALQEDKNVVFIVGGGHIAHGEGSMMKLLEQGGYHLDPIDHKT
jgi:uncharacterized protein YbaP (TraB family)